MLPTWLWSISAHHSEAVDPDLLEWIKDRLDHILNFGPWTIVAGLSVLIILMPVSIIAFYLVQQRRQSAVAPDQREPEDS